MYSWGFALREGVFAETKEGKCRNKREKKFVDATLSPGLSIFTMQVCFIITLMFELITSLNKFIVYSNKRLG